MTTRQLISAVVLLAVWLAFVARARRLRELGAAQMAQYAASSRLALDLRATGRNAEARAAAARHLQAAHALNVEADFVESFTLALAVTVLCFGGAAVLRTRRRRRARDPAP